MTARPRSSRLLAVATSLLLTAAGVVASGVIAPVPARAADAADFRPGNIISDAVFYDETTMTAAEVQGFLNAKLRTCDSGYVCLKDYRQNTFNRPADAQCSAYTGVSNQRASAIIHAVARACGVNPRVLLVLLQKETSLVTRTDPTYLNAYRKATGYGCPDTRACDSAYYGFYNQVYQAAWQYRRYAVNWRNYSYQPGRYNTIQWHPDRARCGTTSLYIHNQATAGLYIYTPYPPNRAAMANLYGTGDSCSAYGNRNFWRLFTDWWGSTQHSVVGPVFRAWQATGGIGGSLGAPIGARYATAGGGVAQAFRKGTIHWSSATGARPVVWPVSWAYGRAGRESGQLGYPTASSQVLAGDGRVQDFQHGRIYYSAATGARSVVWPMTYAHDQLDRTSGVLGYPRANRTASTGGGWSQVFQGGTVHYSSATGARAVVWPISFAYGKSGREAGALGYPVTNRAALAGGAFLQRFQNGRVLYSPRTGARAVAWPVSWAYEQHGQQTGVLGFPRTDTTASSDGGYHQTFDGGEVHYSPVTGARAVLGDIAAEHRALDGTDGELGYPVGNRYATPDSWWAQAFQHGYVYSKAGTGTFAVLGEISATHRALRGEAGALGLPVADRYSTRDGGWSQAFEHGTVHWSTGTGAHAVLWPVSWAYDQVDREAGGLGYPTAARTATVRSGWSQQFQHGSVHYSPATGARIVQWPVSWAYDQARREAGPLGHPVANVAALPAGGRVQVFQGGRVYYSPATGARPVLGALATAYGSLDGPLGVLGYPRSDRRSTVRSGFAQTFQRGSLHSSSTTGTHPVLTEIASAYLARQAEAGALGYPTGPERTTSDGTRVQDFESGTITYRADRGAVVTVR